MAVYRVVLSTSAEKVLRWLDRRDPVLFDRIRSALESLAVDPLQAKPMTGRMAGEFSYRVGSYRILFKIVREKLVVFVIDIGHRREIYR